jgi:hypothetical protein
MSTVTQRPSKGGALDTRIYVPGGPEETTELAAGELSRLLAKVTNRRVTVLHSPPPSPRRRRAAGCEIVVTPVASEATSQGYAIRSSAGRVELIGLDRAGILQATYEFLSEWVGYRFLLPGQDIAPADGPRRLGSRLGDEHAVESRPSFAYRDRTLLSGQNFLADDTFSADLISPYVDWMAKNKMNIGYFFFRDYRRPYWKKLRSHFRSMKARGLQIAVGDHLYRFFVPATRLTRTRSKWFRGVSNEPGEDYINAELSQAHFCGSNPQAIRYFIRGVQAFLDEAPELDFLGVHPNDGGNWCECLKCRPLSISDRFLKIHLALADALAVSHPNVRLVHPAYGPYTAPPSHFRPSKNMVVLFQPWGRDYHLPFNHPACPVHESRNNMMGVSCVDYQHHLDQWLELCAKVGVDLYVHEKYGRQLLLGCHLLPPPCLEDDLKYFHRKGVRGIQLHTAMGGWWTSSTTMHVSAKQLWDVNASATDTTSQIFSDYYGANAALASRVISRYEESAGSWQYANVNVNLNLHQRLVPGEAYPLGLRDFNDRLVEELSACIASLGSRRARSRRIDDKRHLDTLQQTLKYISLQRRVLALDLHRGAALPDRPSPRKLEAALLQARQRGYRRGLCWDVDSPAAAEGIGGVKYRW